MNAYELANGGEHIAQANYSLDNQIRGYLMDMASMLRQQADELKKLKEFVRPILLHGDDCVGNWDGFELQELAVKSGCFIEVERTEPCNLGNEERIGCICREYHYGDESWTCYETAKFLLEN